MAQKQIEIPSVGAVTLVKRKGAKSIRVTINADSSVRVTLPPWVPYQAGIAFASTKRDWIRQHRRPVKLFEDGQLIGKSQRLVFRPATAAKPSSRIVGTEIRISCPRGSDATDPEVQRIAERAALRSLKQQSQALLPQRLQELAGRYGFQYRGVSVKRLKSRWGSCGPHGDITLNIFLMQLPWPLIDYVLLHELSHTRAHNHGRDFWVLFERCLPDAKLRRKQLRAYQPAF